MCLVDQKPTNIYGLWVLGTSSTTTLLFLSPGHTEAWRTEERGKYYHPPLEFPSHQGRGVNAHSTILISILGFPHYTYLMTHKPNPTEKGIIRTYLVTTSLYTLATSMIWGINTLFLMDAGMDIFQVMLINAAFTAGMVIFEIPTGVVADTLGRKTSFLMCIAVLFVSTLFYVGAAYYEMGIWVFSAASVLLGLGYTFFTGAVEAWLVDALDHINYEGSREVVFARGQMVFSSSMLVGTVGGGFLGQVHLSLPYIVRAIILILTFLVALLSMKDLGFEPKALVLSDFGKETRRITENSIRFGWNQPLIKLCMLVSFVNGLFFIFGWCSWQRYFLDLLNRELIWTAGIVSALFSLSGIVGNSLVGKASRSLEGKSSARLLAVFVSVQAFVIVCAGLLGAVFPDSARGLVLFAAAVLLYLVFGLLFGLYSPIRQALINRYIPSEQRATILSMDSFFMNMSGVMGQTGLGYISKMISIPVAWVAGGAVMFLGAPLYRKVSSIDEEAGNRQGGSMFQVKN